jgi:hypothetical protein
MKRVARRMGRAKRNPSNSLKQMMRFPRALLILRADLEATRALSPGQPTNAGRGGQCNPNDPDTGSKECTDRQGRARGSGRRQISMQDA